MIQISEPSVGDDEWNALRQPLLTGWLTQGPMVAEFERAFAERHNVAQALATSSCTTALHLMLSAAGVGPGDEVILPSFTWVATANAVLYTGATPILADVDPVTYNVDVEDVIRRVTDRTRAVIVVHLFGLCADVSALRARLPADIDIFEDAACAAGARSGDGWAGGLGRAAAFSFHPRKSITTGEGGMLTSNDDDLITLAAKLRNHGAEISEEQRHRGPQPYLLPDFNVMGFNYRMTDLQGAVGLAQISRLDSIIQERQRWASFYLESLSNLGWLQLPQLPSDGQHAWQSFVTRVHPDVNRDAVMRELHQSGIATRPGTHAIHTLGYYRDRFGWHADDYPHSRDCQDQTMAIPLHNRMTPHDFETVVNCILDIDV